MNKIKAIIRAGHQVASGRSTEDTRFPGGTIAMQEPFFREQGLDLEDFFGGDFVRGTLNLSVAPYTYSIVKPDYYLKGIKWTPLQPAENFFLSPAEILIDEKAYKAMLYIPDPSTKPNHFQAPDIIEVLAEKIEGVAYGDAVDLLYNPNAICLHKDPKPRPQ